MMFEALPPHDNEAEAQLCAALMEDDTLINRVASLLNAADFFRDEHAWVYEACRTLWERDEMINMVTVAHELDRRGRLEEAGGLTFLSDLVTNLPTVVGAEHYAGIIKRDSVYRQMVGIASNIAQVAYQGGPDLEGAIAKAEALIYGLRSERKTSDFIPLVDFLDKYYQSDTTVSEPAARQVSGIRTGLSQLDALMEGLKPGNLIIVAARTGFGKTSLMLNFARNAATVQRARVAVFSLEMEGSELVDRLVTAECRIATKRIRDWALDEYEEERVINALGLLADAQILFDHCPGIRIDELREKALKLAKRQGVDLIVVDYLQLVKGGKNFGNRVGELTFITNELKTLASQLGVPVVVGSQLSRNPEGRADHRPMLQDLRESGSIEQDADVVLFIYREEKYTPRLEWEKTHPDKIADPYPEAIAELIIAKHRSGPEGFVNVRFRDAYTKFEDFDIPAGSPVQMEAAF